MAVGDSGLISKWDGADWENISSPVGDSLTGVYVASPDEIYACGGQQILLGSAKGDWKVLHTADATLRSIVKWDDRIWVAASDGLSELVDDSLINRKPNLLATQLESRESLLIACPSIIAHTSDGESYRGWRTNSIENLSKNKPVWWR